MTLSRAETSERLAAHGLAPRRSLGQNFVVDANTVRRIARLAAVGDCDHVVEIGAGLGALTRALLETGATVTAVEIDRGLAAVLNVEVAPLGATVVHADALKMDWPMLLGDKRWTLVANLPYNVATPLVCDLLDQVPQIERMLVMVQREVAERLAAAPGSAAYGAVSVKVAYWATAAVVGKVPATVFLPRPNVESALVAITRRAGAAVADDVTPTSCSRSCALALASDARCCGDRWPGSSRSSSSPTPTFAPRRAPKSSTSSPGGGCAGPVVGRRWRDERRSPDW